MCGSRKNTAPLVISVENSWREVSGGGGSCRSLHRVCCAASGVLQWQACFTAPVIAVAAGDGFIAVAGADASLQLLCTHTGKFRKEKEKRSSQMMTHACQFFFRSTANKVI